MLSLPTVASAILALSFPLSGMAAPMLANNGLTTKDDHSQVEKVNQAIKNLADDLNDTTDNLNKIIITALSNARNNDKRQSIKDIAQSILKDEHDADQQRDILISVTTGTLHSRQSQSNNQQNPGQKNNAQPQPSQQAQPKNNNQNSQGQQNQNSQQSQTSQQKQEEQKKKELEEQKKKDAQNQQNQQNQKTNNNNNNDNNNNNNNKPSTTNTNPAPNVVVPQVIKPTIVVAPPTTNNGHSTTTNNNDHSSSTTATQDTILTRIQSIINNPDPESSFRTAIAIGLDR